MRKSISREALPAPQRGRRIPSIATTKGSASEDRPNARDLLATVNSASEGATATWLAFLGTMAYLAVTLGGVTHVDLLLNNETTLPFVNVKVPLVTFFVMAPLAFVLVHFSLLLQHVVLSRKLAAFEARLNKEEPSRNRGTQNIRDELHSYTFTQVVSGKPKGVMVDTAQRLVVSLTLVIFPLLLLTFFQIGFLPYHSTPITWWHRITLLADVGVVVVLARYLAKRGRKSKPRLSDWWHHKSAFREKLIVLWRRKLGNARWTLSRASLPMRDFDYGPILARFARPALTMLRGGGAFAMRIGAYIFSPNRLVIGLLVFFSFCVATLPNRGEQDWDPLDRWMTWVASVAGLSEPLPYCRDAQLVRCPKTSEGTRHAFYPTALLFERKVNETTGKSDSWLGWSRNLIVTDKHLFDDKKEIPTLRGRDLRYATLDRSDLRRADFYDAKLQEARLSGTKLNKAKFEKAGLQGANLSRASLQGTDLSKIRLQDADLSWANLQGAGLFGASLQGANLSRANLQGADLFRASLQGANLSRANLQGADLTEASLQGADLSRANLQGADLFWAALQGAVLTRANLQGAALRWANLQGAGLFGTSLQGADLRLADLQGAALHGARIWRIKGRPIQPDSTHLVSSAYIKMRALDKNEHRAFYTTIAALEALHVRMAKENTPGWEEVEFSSKRVSDRVKPLLATAGDKEWRAGEDVKAWCKLQQQAPPDPIRLSTYLGELARGDDSDKAYLAQRLIYRVLDYQPNAFLETFKSAPTFARIPADLKSRLERAAQADKETTAKRKPEAPGNAAAPISPNVPDVCVDKPPTTGANTP